MAKEQNKQSKDDEDYSEKEQWKDDLDVLPLNYVKPESKKPIIEKAEFDKKKKKRWIPLLALFSILAGATPLILNTCKEDHIPAKKQMAVTASEEIDSQQDTEDENINIVETNEETSFVEDTAIIETMDSEYYTETEVIEEGPKNYHIIVGSFEQEENASKWLEQASYNEYGIQFIKKHEEMYRVIFASYTTIEQATIEIDSIRNFLKLKAWIAYMK